MILQILIAAGIAAVPVPTTIHNSNRSSISECDVVPARRLTAGSDRPIVRKSPAKKGAMTTVMLDHEQANEEACCRDRYREREQIAPAQTEPHRYPKQHEGNRGNPDLQNAAGVTGTPVGFENAQPVACRAAVALPFNGVQGYEPQAAFWRCRREFD